MPPLRVVEPLVLASLGVLPGAAHWDHPPSLLGALPCPLPPACPPACCPWVFQPCLMARPMSWQDLAPPGSSSWLCQEAQRLPGASLEPGHPAVMLASGGRDPGFCGEDGRIKEVWAFLAIGGSGVAGEAALGCEHRAGGGLPAPGTACTGGRGHRCGQARNALGMREWPCREASSVRGGLQEFSSWK